VPAVPSAPAASPPPTVTRTLPSPELPPLVVPTPPIVPPLPPLTSPQLPPPPSVPGVPPLPVP
jgi:hypothetical protein